MRYAYLKFWKGLWGSRDAIEFDLPFFLLPDELRKAVYYHELGHLAYNHIWKRLLWIITGRAFINTSAYASMLKTQELEADFHAVWMGYGDAMVEFLARYCDPDGDRFYPSVNERISSIRDYQKKLNQKAGRN